MKGTETRGEVQKLPNCCSILPVRGRAARGASVEALLHLLAEDPGLLARLRAEVTAALEGGSPVADLPETAPLARRVVEEHWRVGVVVVAVVLGRCRCVLRQWHHHGLSLTTKKDIYVPI